MHNITSSTVANRMLDTTAISDNSASLAGPVGPPAVGPPAPARMHAKTPDLMKLEPLQ